MSKFRLLGFVLFAVFAFGAVAAATASAEETTTFLLAEWLWEKEAILTGSLLVESKGELLLEDTFTGIDILCSGNLVGFVEPASADLITEVLDLSGNAVSTTPLVEPGLLGCITQAGSCVEPIVWAVKLPWSTELELLEDPTGTIYVDLILGNPGWEVECHGSLLKPSDTCEATPVGVLEVMNNPGGTPTGLFSEEITELALLKLALCSASGGAETGIVEGEGLIEHSTGGFIEASSI